MMANIKIVKFDLPNASDDDLNKMIVLSDVLRKERDPDEPKPPAELLKKYIRDTHPHSTVHTWLAFEHDKVIGHASFSHASPGSPPYEDNKHIGQVSIRILPSHRRNGIGSKMLVIALEEAKKIDAITDIFADAQLESGIQFCEKMEGIFSQGGTENRLKIEDINWSLMDEWIADGEKLESAENVSLTFFEDCPDEIIENYIQVYQETMNQQPLGEFDGKITETPETRRLSETRNKEKGMLWYTFASIEKNGDVSGLTEILHHPQVGHKGFQNLTGVKEQYRSRGLGKWLKATMLKWFVEKYPQVKYIVTGNDNTNAPMLSINDRMGFKEFQSMKSYKFNLEKLIEKVKI